MSSETAVASSAGQQTGGWVDVFRYEAERRVRIALVIAVSISLFGALFVWIGPQVTAGIDVDQIAASMPPAMRELFGMESLASLAGLLAGEFYSLGFVVGLGGYLAYSAANSVAGDVESDRMDLLLAAPISRTAVLLGKYLALLVPILVANTVVPAALYAGSVLVGEPLVLADLTVLHLLALPYLLCWCAFGLFVGTLIHDGRTAGRVALGVVVAAWLLESLVTGSKYEWLGDLSPMRYFQPPDVLVHGTYDFTGATLLLGVAVALVLLSTRAFTRTDL